MTVASKKAAFLRRYNPNKSIDKALSRGISASVQHNSLYGDKISQSEKCRLREEWKRLLLELSIKYKSPQSIVTYENDIKQLKDKMNHQFSDFFGCNSVCRTRLLFYLDTHPPYSNAHFYLIPSN